MLLLILYLAVKGKNEVTWVEPKDNSPPEEMIPSLPLSGWNVTTEKTLVLMLEVNSVR